MFEPPHNQEPLAAPVVAPVVAPVAGLDSDQAARLARLQQRRATGCAPADARPAPTSHRRHPARQSRAVAFASSVTASVGLAAYFASTSGATNAAVTFPASPATPTTQPTAAQRAVTPAPVATVPAATVTAARTTASATSTTFTGSVAQMRYGPVQVAITVAGGKIVDISVPVTPTDRKSTNINNRAVPVLDNQAIASQSARVDTVSGATYTSDAYRTSLQSAISAARAAGKL